MSLPADLSPRSFLGPDSVSYSELSKLAKCEADWAYSYLGEREESPTSVALNRGKEIHRLIQHWWMTSQQILPTEDEMVAWLVERYDRQYAQDHLRRMFMQTVELPFALKLPPPWNGHVFGFVDGLVDVLDGEHDGLWGHEVKSMARWDRLAQLPVDRQVSLYIIALRAAGIPVKGVMYDAVRTFKPARNVDLFPLADSFERIWIERTDEELAEAWDELISVLTCRDDIKDRHVGLKDGRTITVSSYRTPIKAIGTNCSWCFNNLECYGKLVTILPEDS